MFDNSPSDRMQLAGLGDLVHPASCMVCGSGNCDQGYVHLGVWYEFEGTQYLCWNCCAQAGEVIGCLTPGEADGLKELVENTTERLALVEKELESANGRLAIYDAVIASAGANPTLSIDATRGIVNEATVRAAERADSGESVAPKPVKSTGRSNVKSPESGDGPVIKI